MYIILGSKGYFVRGSVSVQMLQMEKKEVCTVAK